MYCPRCQNGSGEKRICKECVAVDARRSPIAVEFVARWWAANPMHVPYSLLQQLRES
jgi:hypothetical protein